MPKFLHTADLHLNALRRFSQFYLDRARACLVEVYRIAREHNVDFIVVAGDIYDRRDITHAERLLLSEWLATCDIPIVMISGNHDKRSLEIGDTCITYISTFSNRLGNHLIYDGPPKVHEQFGCYLILLPYQGWMDQELFLILQTLLSAHCRDQTIPVVVVMHEAVYGCKTDVGLSVTKANQIRLDDSFPRVNYWALGDMHLSQQISTFARYSGSPHQTRFDEVEDKGVFIVDTDTPAYPEFVPVPSIPLRILTKVPEEWPSPSEALIQFRPEAAVPDSPLPLNVELHPSVAVLDRRTEPGGNPTVVGLLDGLDDALSRSKLPEELYPLAWRTAIKIAKTAGIEIPLPLRYQTQEDTDEQ